MALPHALQLREIKYGDKSTDQLRIQTAELLQREGRMAEALDLFLLASHDEGIAGLRQHACQDGRPALLIMLRRAGHEIEADEWRRAGQAAEKNSRWRDAFRAYTEAADEESLARVRERIPEYDVYVPQGK